MIVVIDIGNTRIKWARVKDDSGRLAETGRALHVDSPDQAFDALERGLPDGVTRLLATNVAGEVIAARLVTFAIARWGVEPEFLEPAAEQYGVRCAYRDPARLGPDRWAAVIAAHHRVAGPACVIDAGTTVTFDALDGEGLHLGGLIMPGPRIVATALHRDTRNIGATRGVRHRPHGLALLGTSTDQSVGHGAMLGLAAAIDRAAAMLERELGVRPTALLTGGDGPLLQPWLETRVEYRADLVLEGLAIIASDPHA